MFSIEFGQLSGFSDCLTEQVFLSPQAQNALNSLRNIQEPENFVNFMPPSKTSWAIKLFLNLLGINVPDDEQVVWHAWKDFFASIQDQ